MTNKGQYSGAMNMPSGCAHQNPISLIAGDLQALSTAPLLHLISHAQEMNSQRMKLGLKQWIFF